MNGSESFEDKPWIQGDLHIRKEVMSEIEAHAKECYPSESCGFLMGPSNSPALIDEARREENEADKYHRLDPETFPRTSRSYFKINELRAARTFEEGETNGRPVKIVYHSHCDVGAYFSDEDAATFSHEGQLMWPCAFLVMSVRDGEVVDRKLWVHDPKDGSFRESTLTVA